jgi:hypothetical protein
MKNEKSDKNAQKLERTDSESDFQILISTRSEKVISDQHKTKRNKAK